MTHTATQAPPTAPIVAPDAGTRVTLRGVRRVFAPSVLVLDDLSLDVTPGEFLAVLGPSGSGKSTLLRLIAGLDRPDGGSVELADTTSGAAAGATDTTPRRSPIAYVFQDAHLLPWRTVLSNVALPLELAGVGRAERTAVAAAAIRQVGLDDAAGRYPAQLSGGMRMRVSLARALVTDPKLLLLDEPFAALDEITRQRLDEQLRDLWASRRMTVIFVTHSISEAVFLAQRAVVLSRRPARVLLDRPIDLPTERPQAIRTGTAFARDVQALYEALRREES